MIHCVCGSGEFEQHLGDAQSQVHERPVSMHEWMHRATTAISHFASPPKLPSVPLTPMHPSIQGIRVNDTHKQLRFAGSSELAQELLCALRLLGPVSPSQVTQDPKV